MESFVREAIMGHIRNNNLFRKFQYGFINRRSTTLQLLFILDDWAEILDQGGHNFCSLCSLYMKAFDKHLLHKLSSYGISGHLHYWIRSFIRDRTQRVNVDSPSSKSKSLIKQTRQILQCELSGGLLITLIANFHSAIQKHSPTWKYQFNKLAWWHQLSYYQNADFAVVRFDGTDLRTISQRVSKLLFCIRCLKSILSRITATSHRGQWVK